MSDLLITRAQPNPYGKDRTLYFAPNEQLNQEWVEFVNVRSVPLSLGGVSLWHETYQGLERTGEEVAGIFYEHVVLRPGWTLRVHTGHGTPFDAFGVHHSFLNRGNYVWNNAAGDRLTLRDASGLIIDSTWYAPYPPEGEILLRVAA